MFPLANRSVYPNSDWALMCALIWPWMIILYASISSLLRIMNFLYFFCWFDHQIVWAFRVLVYVLLEHLILCNANDFEFRVEVLLCCKTCKYQHMKTEIERERECKTERRDSIVGRAEHQQERVPFTSFSLCHDLCSNAAAAAWICHTYAVCVCQRART